MVTTPTVDNAVAWFGAHTVTHHLDVVDLDDVRFGFAVDKCIAKVAVRKHAVSDALQAVFNVHGVDPDAVKVESVVLPADSVVEWLHTKSNVFISFYENVTSDDPWLRICEPA